MLWEIFINHLYLEHMYVLIRLPKMYLTLTVIGIFFLYKFVFIDPYEIRSLTLSHLIFIY